jgi:peptidoglycan LD-endopeptidase LytH
MFHVMTRTRGLSIPVSAVLLTAAVLTGCTPFAGRPARTDHAAGATPTTTGVASAGPGPVYVFPVRAARARFGRAHHDYPATDIFAPCGSPALAPTEGVVSAVSRKDLWTPGKNTGATRGGLSVAIVGTDGVRYYGSHLKSVVPAVVPGHRVRVGEVLGQLGKTGSARSTSCHLHFGISPPCATSDWWNRRGVLSPYPFLRSWQDRGRRSPVQAVTAWRAKHGCPAKAPSSAAE